MKHGKMKDKLTKSRNKKTKKAFKLSMGDEDMGAIAKMEKGGIVKMMKGGKVGYMHGGLVHDLEKLNKKG